ncbi:MAG: class I adenylate-forming enzyme family protein [Promethearchaeota archaeon]
MIIIKDQEKNKKCLQLAEEIKSYPRMFDWVDRWAKEMPNTIALIEYNTGAQIAWKDFATTTKAFAAKLLSMGIQKGDVIATTLPLLKEHVYVMYACYRIGAIFAPLDLRLKTAEVDDCFKKMRPKMYLSLGKTEVADFRPILQTMIKKYSTKVGGPCEYFVQFQTESEFLVEGAIGIAEFAKDIKRTYIVKGVLGGSVKRAQKKVGNRDPILLVFTTGSTGRPKAALLCSENILIQNIGLAVGFGLIKGDSMCINLPLSHVGCSTEQLATIIFGGGVAVLLHIFDAEKTLDAIQKYNITFIGQIPALYSMQWRLPNYNEYDLSSLRFALYGGQSVTKVFLEKMFSMAKYSGSGLGLTETAGFCTYTPLNGTIDDILASIGYDSPLCPISIRKPMKEDGSAGDELSSDEIGEICFSGPQVFLGYLHDEKSTIKTISIDGILYTGDLGFYDDSGLHLSGRRKFLIKPKGYNVFPTEVEEFLQENLKDRVSNVAVVGAHHDIFTEGIIAFIEPKKGASISSTDVLNVAKGMASYKRPNHVEIIEPESMPLNRVNKTDYMNLKDRTSAIIKKLRNDGKWDKMEIKSKKNSDFNEVSDVEMDLKRGKIYKQYDL